jgi:hypothetical protein
LNGFRPDLVTINVQSLAQLNLISMESFRNARLISFLSSVIIPETTLKLFGFGAYKYTGILPRHIERM